MEIMSASKDFIVKQQLETMEVLTGSETTNRYEILSDRGQKLMDAVENTDWCKRHCCRSCGTFKIKFTQGLITLANLDADVDCCGQDVMVRDGDKKNLIGVVRKGRWVCPCVHPNFHVSDTEGTHVYTIRTPWCVHWCTCFRAVRFPIISSETGSEVGHIERRPDDFVVNTMTDRDTFHLILDEDVPREHKALLLAAIFPIDFSYYER